MHPQPAICLDMGSTFIIFYKQCMHLISNFKIELALKNPSCTTELVCVYAANEILYAHAEFQPTLYDSQNYDINRRDICDWTLENPPYGCVLVIKCFALKSSLKFYILLIHGSNKLQILWITYINYRNIRNGSSDVISNIVNSKILIVSGALIRVIFQNSVT